MGGCQYHVAHPGGLSHEDFPVNAYKAESRRLARFFRMGHTPGQMSVQPAAAEPGVPVHARPAPALSQPHPPAVLQTQSQSSLPFFADDASAAGRAARAELLRRSPRLDAGAWDELRQRRRPAARALARLLRPAARAAAGRQPGRRPGPPRRAGGAADPPRRHHPQRLRRRGRGAAALAAGAAAADHRAGATGPPSSTAWCSARACSRRMLADVYGPQQLLHEGLLPPALLLRHRGYLRSMRGVAPASGQRLHIVAFDLVRAPDGAGRWWRGARQGPSGLGYVLHNRLVDLAPVPRCLSRAARAAHRLQLPPAARFDREPGARGGRRRPRRASCC